MPLRCPKCSTIVHVQPGHRPVCPSCGHGRTNTDAAKRRTPSAPPAEGRKKQARLLGWIGTGCGGLALLGTLHLWSEASDAWGPDGCRKAFSVVQWLDILLLLAPVALVLTIISLVKGRTDGGWWSLTAFLIMIASVVIAFSIILFGPDRVCEAFVGPGR